MKKLLLSILCLVFGGCIAFGLASCYAPDNSEYSDGTFKYTRSSYYSSFTIVGCTDTIEGDIVIPSQFNESSVTGIADYAFRGADRITSVSIHSDITYIAPSAFAGCAVLERITVSDKNENFLSDDGVLYSADKSRLITFPDGKKTERFSIPDSVTEITEYSFYECLFLKEITVNSPLENIDTAFKSCVALESLALNCDDENYRTDDGILYDADMKEIIFYPGAKSLTSFTVPQTVTDIRLGAFEGARFEELTLGFIGKSVNAYADGATHFGYIFGAKSYEENAKFVPDSLKKVHITGGEISAFAFKNCASLETVEIDSNVHIADYSFNGCSAISTFTLAFNPNAYESYFGKLFSNGRALNSDNCASAIPSSLKSVTVIGETVPHGAFNECKNIESITLSESVNSIGSLAFAETPALNEINYNIPELDENFEHTAIFKNAGKSSGGVTINLGKNVKSIPAHLFKSMAGISEIKFADGCICERIGDYSFNSPLYMLELTIPDTVQSIGYNALVKAENLKTLTLGKGLKQLAGYTEQIPEINSFPSLETLNFNAVELSITDYPFQNAGKNSDGLTINIGAEVKSIPDNMFYSSYVTSVNFAEGSPCTIGQKAFSKCAALESVTLSERVTEIGSRAFNYCSALKNFTMSATTENVSATTFENCVGLENITVTGDGKYSSQDGVLFNGDKSTLVIYPRAKTATEYVVPSSVTEIGGTAFMNCSALEKVSFPVGLKKISGLAFLECTALKSVVLPDGVHELVYRAFVGCASLESVVIPTSLKIIGSATFEDCPILKIYYKGDEESSRLMLKNGQNPAEYGVPLLFYSELNPYETGATYDYDLWHYNDGEIEIWAK